MKGIDVSKHQGVIDWNKVKKDGIEFAILRIGYGSNIESQTDNQVLRNAKECDRLGIPYGLYIYSYALNESDAHSEAQHMIRIAKQVNATLGYFYDMEDADGYKEKHNFNPRTHKTELTTFCKIFLEDMKKAGYDNVGTYASYDYFKNILDLASLRKLGKIWLAHWGISKPSIECDFWQYTDVGRVSGIKGNVDMNIAYIDSKQEVVIDYYQVPEFTLTDHLNKIGVDSSIANRKKIATRNRIANYTGTKEQNTKMLELLKAGKLIKV